MAGWLETGGFIDHLFDPVRSELGAADSAIQGWFHDKLNQDSDRYAVQRVLWLYVGGIKDGQFTKFAGMNDPQAEKIVSYIEQKISFDTVFIYNILYALYETAKTDTSSASVLAGGGTNFLDDVLNGTIVDATAGVVNSGFRALGFPSVANTVLVVVIIAVIGGLIYMKVRK